MPSRHPSDLPMPSLPAASAASTAAASALPDEVARFERLSATWWDARGPMRPLHVVNELRSAFIADLLMRHTGRPGLRGLRILDVGCGAGLMSESLARRGAQVTGVDAAAGNVAAARLHAAAAGFVVDYRHGDPAGTLDPGETFDAVLLLEVVEHVDDMPAFVAEAMRHLGPNGLLVASTIDRTWKSFLFAIVGAEWVLRLLPRGTHAWRRFVRPGELAAAAGAAGLAQTVLVGMHYLPVWHRASWCADTSVNYLAAYCRGAPRRTPEVVAAARFAGSPVSHPGSRTV